MRWSLGYTADDLRTSRAAQRGALDWVAPFLPDGVAVADTAAAGAFLARFDRERAVRRPALAAAYEAEGCPGGLSRSALSALAAERWGRAVKSSGHFTYRPLPAVSLALA